MERSLYLKYYHTDDLVAEPSEYAGLTKVNIKKDDYTSNDYYFAGDVKLNKIDFSKLVSSCAFSTCTKLEQVNGYSVTIEYNQQYLLDYQRVQTEVKKIAEHFLASK